jgi:glycosyltransferase involved in cell wall biosynthesis
MLPKVTVIIATYNRAKAYLLEALESVLAQTYPNIEVIVVNDGSTDDTAKVLAPYMKYIRYIYQENGGCAAAKNTGLAAATGDCITNLDDDDRIDANKIALQVEAFCKNPNLGICGTGVYFIDADGNITESYIPPRFTPRTQTLMLLRRCLLVQSSVMIRRDIHRHLGNYKLMLSEDYDFWLRASLHYEIGVVEDYLTDYRIHGEQITGPKTRPELMAAVEQIIRDFIAQTPMAQIIPDLRSEIYGDALIGVLLTEQNLGSLSETYLNRVLPNEAGHIGLGLLRLHEKKFDAAETHFSQVTEAPFVALASDALQLTARVAATLPRFMRVESAVVNTHPDIVRLREETSLLHTAVIRRLFRLARGRE